ncbi:integral membrane protein [Rhexocercosporidium sp. MPI-PUGE-AT-0058]|nr:integral membrane protein [Rhexocercosporidium sp. MPI-PUGE-AT-0058]
MDLLGLLVCWFCWTALASCQSPKPLPTCALVCLGQTIPQSGCAPTDLACQCTSKNLTVSAADCMLTNCSMADTLALAKFQASVCKAPVQNKSPIIVSVFVAVTTVASVFVAARFIHGSLRGNKLGLEDWIVTGGLILASLPIALTLKMAGEGFGKHLYSLEDGDLKKFLKDFYIAENTYVVVLAVTKLSILSFYLRIFKHIYWFCVQVWATIALICVSTAIISILTIFQCHPIDYFWDRDISGGACLDVNALAYANSGMSMAQDVIITLLPLREVLRLNMSQRKKIEAALMFALGGFGCIVSAIRLKVLLGFGNSIDPTWDYVFVVIWTAMELGVAIVLSCLPPLRSLILRLYSKHFPSSSSSSRGTSPRWVSSRSKKTWLGNKGGFLELSDVSDSSQAMTNITVNGEDYTYPKKLPAVPSKIIWRDSEGKFNLETEHVETMAPDVLP